MAHRTCSVDGCSRKSRTRGWCRQHYQRWLRNGDPNKVQRQYAVYRRTRHDGYIDVYEPDHPLAGSNGYVAEHRKVMHDLGYDLTGLHVHHRNGVKDDNRPENLEVLTAEEHAAHHADGWVSNQFGTWPRRPEPPPRAESCRHCGGGMDPSLRRDAVYCSPRCRVNHWKRTRGAA